MLTFSIVHLKFIFAVLFAKQIEKYKYKLKKKDVENDG